MRELLSNNSLFVGKLLADKSPLQLTRKQGIITQLISYMNQPKSSLPPLNAKYKILHFTSS